MANREIKTTLALDGEAKFKSGLESINNNFKTLNSEMAVVTSGYDKNNASVKDLTAKGDILAKQIEQQKAKHAALKNAVNDATAAYNQAAQKAKDAAEKFGENSKEAKLAAESVGKAEKNLDKYTQQANYAERDLNKLTASQKANNEEIKKVGKSSSEINKLKTSFENLSKKLGPVEKGLKDVAGVSFGTLKAGIDGVTKGLTAYAAAATGAGTAAFAVSASAAQNADDLNTMAKVTGLTTEQLQGMQYASNLIDVDVDTMTGSMAKLTKNMYSAQQGGKATSEAFASLGVSVTDSNGNLRSNQDVFNDSIAALGNIKNETERDAVAMQIFGKSAQDLNPLIEGGAEQLKNLSGQAKDAGLIMSQTALDDLNAFNDSLDIMKSNVSASGNIIGGTFAGQFKGFTDIIGAAVPGIAKSFSDMFGVGDMEQKTADFTARLTKFAEKIIAKINSGLPTMLAAFNAVIVAIVTAISNTLPETIKTVLPAFLTGFNNLISGFIAAIPDILPALVDGGIMLFTGLLDSLQQIIDQLMPMLPDMITKISDTLIENLPTMIDAGFNILTGLINGIVNAIPSLIDSVVKLIPVIVKGFTNNLPKIMEAGIQIIVALAKGLPQAIPAVIEAIPEIVGALIDTIFETDWLDIGVQILKGIADGLIEGVKAIGDTIKKVASSVVDGFKNFFGIHSPSRVFRDQVGKYLAQGIGTGFTDEMAGVTKKMQNAVPHEFEILTNTNAAVEPVTTSGKRGSGTNVYQYNYAARALTEREKYRYSREGVQFAGAY